MITIRFLRKSDKKAFDRVFTKTVQADFPEYSKNIRNYFAKADYRGYMFQQKVKIGAFDGRKLVGYLVAGEPFGGVLFIYWMAITKEYRRKGVGTLLLKKVEETGLEKGAHSIQFQVDKINLPFYKSNGYEVIGLDKKGYFGTDNYILKKMIQEPKEENFLK